MRTWLKKLRWQKKIRSDALRDLYQQKHVSPKQKVSDTDFLVVDCEMTGLDPSQDRLISIGWIKICNGKIDFGKSGHNLVYSERSVGSSAKIHGLQDAQIAGATNPSRALNSLLQQIHGTVLVFHHAHLDLQFLNRAMIKEFGGPLCSVYVDTMQIELRRQRLRNKQGSVKLNDCRTRYGLPLAPEHNALFDARSTAELLLAQCAHMGGINKLSLNDIGLRRI